VPTYEYECRQCGHRFEVFQSIKDAPLAACERCGGEVRRLISGGAGLLFKGSGFYLTDYRSASYKKGAREEGGSGRGDGAKGAPAGEGGGAKPGGSDAGGGSPEKRGGAAKDGA
jgi:putative FmdB family regulatory protein